MSAPLLAITAGDPAGTGPGLIVRALALPEVHAPCRSHVVDDAAVPAQALACTGSRLTVRAFGAPEAAAFSADTIDMLDQRLVDVTRLQPDRVDPGSLVEAIELAAIMARSP